MSRIENDLNPDVTIGLSLPLTHDNSFGFFKTTQTLLEQAKHNIRNLLLTKRGERLGNPNFGSDLHLLLFEQDAGDLESKIEETILEAISNNLPYVTVNNIEVSNTEIDKNMYVVNLHFTIDTDQTKEEELSIDVSTIG
tara:strand:+ start:434 stop:850 length:417 start_codon:yes stop_codon:yes gene_type:complete